MHRYRLRPVEGHRPIVGRWPSLVSLERGVMMGVPIIFDKPFKTYDEQIKHLRDDYGLEITDEESARYVLCTFSYYDIINGYQECMMENGKFKSGISMMYLYIFHHFDKAFQNVIFKNILVVETSFKTKLAYILSERYGVSMYDYLNKANFKPQYKRKIVFSKVKRNIMGEITFLDRKTNKIIYCKQPTKHYYEKHHHIPAWILMKNISFDNAINLYSLLKQEDKEKVTLEMVHGDISISDKISFLMSSLNLIRKFRNVIAHNLKFVTYKQEKSKLPRQTTVKLIDEPLATNGIIEFDNLYGCILAIYVLLNDKQEKIIFIKELLEVLLGGPLGLKKLSNLNHKTVMDYMKITNLGEDLFLRLTTLLVLNFKKAGMTEENSEACRQMYMVLESLKTYSNTQTVSDES